METNVTETSKLPDNYSALLDAGVAVYQVREVFGSSAPESEQDKWFVSTVTGSMLDQLKIEIPSALTENDAWHLASKAFGTFLSAPQRHEVYNTDNFPTRMFNHGNFDIWANAQGRCAAIPTREAAVLGCRASHFGDLRYVKVTLPKEYAAWEAAQRATVYQPDADHMPDEMLSSEVFSSLANGKARFPGVPDAAWLTLKFGDVQNATILDADDDTGDTESKLPADEVLEQYIKIAADSIAGLRKVDVFRVLDSVRKDNIDGVTRFHLAVFIVQKRPDLCTEVSDVMNEEFAEEGFAVKATALYI